MSEDANEGVYWRYLPKSRRARFTVVEYLAFFFGAMVLLRIALPFGLQRIDQYAAAEVLESVATLESAARNAATNGDLAALRDVREGVVPPGLDAYLPDAFAFDRDRWVLDWDLYEVHDQVRELLVGNVHGAIEMRIQDERLRTAVIRLAGRRVWMVDEDRVSVLVPNLTGVDAES